MVKRSPNRFQSVGFKGNKFPVANSFSNHRSLGVAKIALTLDSHHPAVDNGKMNRHLLLPLVLTKLE